MGESSGNRNRIHAWIRILLAINKIRNARPIVQMKFTMRRVKVHDYSWRTTFRREGRVPRCCWANLLAVEWVACQE